jgi:hypothetical protein
MNFWTTQAIAAVEQTTKMNESRKDTYRAIDALTAILDKRDPTKDCSSILVTAEHTVAAVLLALFPDPAKAAAMLNEGLLPGIESRLSLYRSKMEQPK